MKENGASFFYDRFTAALRCTVCLGFLCIPSFLFAQTRGKVEVDKDPKVDSLIGNYLVGKKNSGVADAASSSGYRVQIFSGADRKGAYDVQARFQDKFPELRTYLSYHDPYFKVRVGDFRTRLEAEKMMQELRATFTSLFIISEKINLPKLDTE